jgi:DNA-binding transcriptional MerR regulator
MKHKVTESGDKFTDSSGKLARDSQVSIPTIASYARKGLLLFVVCSNGHRMFLAGQAAKVRKIHRQRMQAMGRAVVAQTNEETA